MKKKKKKKKMKFKILFRIRMPRDRAQIIFLDRKNLIGIDIYQFYK